jgi:hypothetical protein
MQRMFNPLDHPSFILVVSLVTFWISAWIGGWIRVRRGDEKEKTHEDFTLVLGATLTLLGLIVGFTFSMAVNRYDQRKNYEEQEANAIGTEYVRADLLPVEDAAKVHALLRSYLDHRVLGYKTNDQQQLRQVNTETARLQIEMWSAVRAPVAASPTPVAAVILGGMNDVLNSQGYTQAAWWNRIPVAAWALLTIISVFCNILVGYVAHGRSVFLFLILPIALSISLFLIADIDSPHNGIIRVVPQNLESLADSFHRQ